MKIFEIPYNFDTKLINALLEIDPSGDSYHSIYLPPYGKDYFSAKRYYKHAEGQNMKNLLDLSREEYENHINYIKKYYANKIMLLLQ